MKNILRLYTIISISLLFVNKVSANVDLTVKSLTTQNEYVSTYSGSEYLQGTLEIGITTDENINYVQMGMNHYNSMGLGLPYGGLVEQYDFSMSSLSGATIYGYHNMFPQEYYIPAGTTDETLMYIPILISENNDEEFCIQYPDFKDLEGNSLVVNLGDESCISIDELNGLDSNTTDSNTLTIQVIDSSTGDGIEGVIGNIYNYNTNTLPSLSLSFVTNDSGYAFLEGYPNSAGAIEVYRQGYQPSYQEYNFSGSEQVTISMEPNGFTDGETDTLTMQFTDSNTGQGIEGVSVSIYLPSMTGEDCWNGACTIFETTDDSGYITVQDFPLGPGWMESYVAGYNPISTQFTFSGSEQLSFTMEPYGDFEGETDTLVIQVVDSNTGQGIAGAEGTIWSFSGNNNLMGEEVVFPFVTNEDGYVSIDNFPIGYGFAEIITQGYLPGFLQFEFTGSQEFTISMNSSDDVGDNFESLVFQFIDAQNGEAIENVMGFAMNYSEGIIPSMSFDFISDEFGFAYLDFPLGDGVIDAYTVGYEHTNLQFEFSGNETIIVEMQSLDQFNSASITGTVGYELEQNSFLTPFVFAMNTDASLNSYCSSVAVDGTGNYELPLSPGEYVIGALYFTNPNIGWYENASDSINDMGFQLQFFENSMTFEDATIIQVNEGESLGNISFNFVSNDFMAFNGQAGNIVMGEITSDNSINMESTLVSVVNMDGEVLSEQTIGQDQTFTITGLAQNTNYILKASHDEYGFVERSFSPNSMVHIENIEFNLSALSTINDNNQIPKVFTVSQNFPNPFNPLTTLQYTIPNNAVVKITIFDNMGRLVKNLMDGYQIAGRNTIQWNATDNMSQPVPAGMYIYRIQVGSNVKTSKMIYLK